MNGVNKLSPVEYFNNLSSDEVVGTTLDLDDTFQQDPAGVWCDNGRYNSMISSEKETEEPQYIEHTVSLDYTW